MTLLENIKKTNEVLNFLSYMYHHEDTNENGKKIYSDMINKMSSINTELQNIKYEKENF